MEQINSILSNYALLSDEEQSVVLDLMGVKPLTAKPTPYQACVSAHAGQCGSCSSGGVFTGC